MLCRFVLAHVRYPADEARLLDGDFLVDRMFKIIYKSRRPRCPYGEMPLLSMKSITTSLKFTLATALFVLAVLTASGAAFRLSFLDEKPVLDDTCQLLKENGFSEDSVAKFKKLVEDHNRPGNRVDRTLFPPLQGGYYGFDNFGEFTNRMPRRFSETPGDNSLSQNTLMCFDVACLLLHGAGCEAPRLEDDFASKDFVSIKDDGSVAPVAAKKFRSAIGVLFPASGYEMLVGKPRSGAETQIGLSLRAKRRLPPGCTNTDKDLRSIFAAYISGVKKDGFQFPKNVQIGLGLIVNTKLHYILGDHAFICIQKAGRFICLEKNGAKGPFVRVEFESEKDVAHYMSWSLLLSDAANPKDTSYGSSVLISLNDQLIGIFQPNIRKMTAGVNP